MALLTHPQARVETLRVAAARGRLQSLVDGAEYCAMLPGCQAATLTGGGGRRADLGSAVMQLGERSYVDLPAGTLLVMPCTGGGEGDNEKANGSGGGEGGLVEGSRAVGGTSYSGGGGGKDVGGSSSVGVVWGQVEGMTAAVQATVVMGAQAPGLTLCGSGDGVDLSAFSAAAAAAAAAVVPPPPPAPPRCLQLGGPAAPASSLLGPSGAVDAAGVLELFGDEQQAWLQQQYRQQLQLQQQHQQQLQMQQQHQQLQQQHLQQQMQQQHLHQQAQQVQHQQHAVAYQGHQQQHVFVVGHQGA